MTLDDYPFDPALRGQEMHHRLPDKLKCIEDPILRRLVWDGWTAAQERKEQRPSVPEQTRLPWNQRPASRELLDPNPRHPSEPNDDDRRDTERVLP